MTSQVDEVERPTWFGPPERPLAGWVHTPTNPRSRTAVVLCPPLGIEQSSAYYALRELSVQLADAGIASVRFDYDGTGDSAGDDLDAGRLDAWTRSIVEAADLARGSGADRIVLVGLRMGGLLAALAAQRHGPFTALVLWDPCRSGRAFIREQRTLYRICGGSGERNDGSVEVPGYLISGETIVELESLTMPALGRELSTRTLVLSRPDLGPRELEHRDDTSVEWTVAREQAEFLDVDPYFQVLPTTTIDMIVDWLISVSESDPPLPACESSPPLAPTTHARARVLGEHAVFPSGNGRSVVERMCSLGPNGLFGIETAPASGQPSAEAPTVLFLNSGYERHTGPNRLWVQLARQWAGLGIRSIRFDMSGLGESSVRPGQATHVLRAPEAFDDVADVAHTVSADDPSNVVLIGLCSGAYQALESALMLSPRGVCAINPWIRFAPPETPDLPIDPRRRICRPRTAAVEAYRALPLSRIRDWIRPLVWKWANRVPGPSKPKRWLADLVQARVRTLIVCGKTEEVPVLYGAKRVARKLQATGWLHVERLEGIDHALILARQREHVDRALSTYVLSLLNEAGPARPSRLQAAEETSRPSVEVSA